jgi:hypothetical protein
MRGREEEVVASELDPLQRVWFFRDVFGPVPNRMPFGYSFIRTVGGVDLDRPLEAADGRCVFALHPLG